MLWCARIAANRAYPIGFVQIAAIIRAVKSLTLKNAANPKFDKQNPGKLFRDFLFNLHERLLSAKI
jgi:hypothetical protein